MAEPPFEMIIDEVFWISSRPFPIATSRDHSGNAKVGDRLDLIDEDGTWRAAVVVRAVELICRVGSPAVEPMPVNLALGDELGRGDVRVGQKLRATE